MELFGWRTRAEQVERLLLRLVNRRQMIDRRLGLEGPRLENRTALTLIVWVVPIIGRKAIIEQAFATCTKDLAARGLSILVNRLPAYDELVVGLPDEQGLAFVRCRVRQTTDLGAGFWQVGLTAERVVTVNDFPELAQLPHELEPHAAT